MPKAVVLHGLHNIKYEEIKDDYVYKPTQDEEIAHGTRVCARQKGEPQDGEIEVKALVGAVCTHEVSLFLGDLTHPRYPMIPGHEAVHRVTKVGRSVNNIKEGDLVSCCWYMGQWSEKLIGPANTAFRLPDGVKDPAHWIIEPAASVVNAVNYMNINPGDRVLLIGAGFMGLLIIQLLKGYPMSAFVASDIKKANRNLALQCGAYEAVNPLEEPTELSGDKLYDVVIECTGTQIGLDTAVALGGMASRIYLFGWHRHTRSIDFKSGHLRGQQFFHTSPAIDHERVYERYWPQTIELFSRGIFDLTPLISHRYKASDIAQCMEESVARSEGFVKSIFYLSE